MALLIIESIIIVLVISLLMRLVLTRWTNLIVHSIVWLPFFVAFSAMLKLLWKMP
jgi:hypothetical protein